MVIIAHWRKKAEKYFYIMKKMGDIIYTKWYNLIKHLYFLVFLMAAAPFCFLSAPLEGLEILNAGTKTKSRENFEESRVLSK